MNLPQNNYRYESSGLSELSRESAQQITAHSELSFENLRGSKQRVSQKYDETARNVTEISLQVKFPQKAPKAANFAEIRVQYSFSQKMFEMFG